MSWFYLYMNIEGRVWCYTATSSLTQWRWKIHFHGQFAYGLSIPDVKLKLYWLFGKFENWRILRSWRIFLSKVSPEIGYSNQMIKNIPYILSFWLMIMLKNGQIAFVEEFCWRYVKAFISYAWTSIWTDKHRNQPTNIVAKMQILVSNEVAVSVMACSSPCTWHQWYPSSVLKPDNRTDRIGPCGIYALGNISMHISKLQWASIMILCNTMKEICTKIVYCCVLLWFGFCQFYHILHCYNIGAIETITRLPQCRWSNHLRYG